MQEQGPDESAAEWGEPGAEIAEGEALVVDVSGFEGPLDLLLALARTQKVDLARISMTALVDQYLAFVTEAQKLRLELAADYLLMAAWLAFLKSRLLLPRETLQAEEVSAEEMAQRLAFRLMRLDAMRTAAGRLMTRKRLGRDVFQRGMPEPVRTLKTSTYSASLHDLLRAYADQRRRTIKVTHVVRARPVWSIKEARGRLSRLVGEASVEGWVQLDLMLEQYMPSPELSRTARASSFGASLEMVNEGMVDLRQETAFGPIFLRRKGTAAAAPRQG